MGPAERTHETCTVVMKASGVHSTDVCVWVHFNDVCVMAWQLSIGFVVFQLPVGKAVEQ